MATLMLYIGGHAINETKLTNFVKNMPALKDFLDFYHFVFPGFYKLNIKNFVIYKHNLESSYLFSIGSYSILYSLFLLILIVVIFQKKDLD